MVLGDIIKAALVYEERLALLFKAAWGCCASFLTYFTKIAKSSDCCQSCLSINTRYKYLPTVNVLHFSFYTKFVKLLRSNASLPKPVMCTIPFPVRISGHSSRHGVHSLGNPKDFPLTQVFLVLIWNTVSISSFLFSEVVINSYVSWFSRIQQMGKCLQIFQKDFYKYWGSHWAQSGSWPFQWVKDRPLI